MEKMSSWAKRFYGGDLQQTTAIDIVWGVKPNVKDINKWDSDAFGKVTYDNDFDLSSIESQQFIYDICQELKVSYTDHIYNPTEELKCFMFDLIHYSNIIFPLDQSTVPIICVLLLCISFDKYFTLSMHVMQ
eukprot:111543_1